MTESMRLLDSMDSMDMGLRGLCLGWEDPLEKGVATHSSILAWRIPWTEKPGRLQRPSRRTSG